MEKQCNECKNPILEVKDLRVKFSVHKKSCSRRSKSLHPAG